MGGIPDTRGPKASGNGQCLGKPSHLTGLPLPPRPPTSFPTLSLPSCYQSAQLISHFLALLRVVFILPTPTFHREILTQPLGDSPVPPCQLFVRPPHRWPDAETYPDAAPLLAWEHTALCELQTWAHVTVSLAAAPLMPSSQ